eukprot:TRINITY_DN12974_c0_g1_i1.p1 TRINITY_DN12974_c0_g1~~TRINITY_DN12974_c0_g1_i1.p1  ORF type:complete len:111 (+),score=21.48 TRINITY_DN12974_c0_g1_i1:52-384(+)
MVRFCGDSVWVGYEEGIVSRCMLGSVFTGVHFAFLIVYCILKCPALVSGFNQRIEIPRIQMGRMIVMSLLSLLFLFKSAFQYTSNEAYPYQYVSSLIDSLSWVSFSSFQN